MFMSPWPHRLCLIALASTFLLLLIGGTVNPSGSSLACPDWPLCYGKVFPAMENGVEFEHTHRLAASFVGLLTLVLAVILWRARPIDRLLRRLGIVAVCAVVLQGVLGGITVIFRLPTAVSVTHLGLSMLFFLLLLFLTLRTRRPQQSTNSEAHGERLARGLAGMTTVLIYLQLLLGALVRHTNAGRACGNDMVFCAGQAWPFWPAGQLQMIHRFFGVALTLVVVAVAPVIFSHARRRSAMLGAVAALLPLLIVVQIGLGMATVSTNIALVPVTAHLGVGALLLAGFALLFFELRPARLQRSQKGTTEERIPFTKLPSLGDAGRRPATGVS